MRIIEHLASEERSTAGKRLVGTKPRCRLSRYTCRGPYQLGCLSFTRCRLLFLAGNLLRRFDRI
jgi:hypothetical protein